MKIFKMMLLALCLPSLWACHKESKAIDESEYVKIGYLPSADLLPYVVAQQHGIFDSLHLAVKLMPMEDALNRDTLFLQKVTDGVILSSVEAFKQQSQGVSLVPVAPNEGRMVLVASADSNFVSLRQIRNRCLTVENKGVSAFYAEQLIARLNLTTDDLGMPSLADERIRQQMLLAGQVDAAILTEPLASQSYESGCKMLSESTSMHALYSVLAFSDSIVQTQGPKIQQLLMGYNLAVRYMNQTPQREWLPQAIAQLGLAYTPDSLPPYRMMRPMQPMQVNAVTDWMKIKNILPENSAPARVNNAFVQEAMKLDK